MSVSEKDYWIGFSVFPGVGPITFQDLLSRFKTAQLAWEAPEKELLNILKEQKTKEFLYFRQTFDSSRYKDRLEKAQVSILTLVDPGYPARLKEIKNPPFVLYIKTHNKEIMQLDDKKIIAIVGTRKVTHYGREVTKLFTKSLVSAGYTIISGLAMGVDTIAHQTTIDTAGELLLFGGCGIDCCYPRENGKLYCDKIIETGGAVISEFPLGMRPTRGTFPARNRIVAALSHAVVVTEATVGSGSLITAAFGSTYGRKIFAVTPVVTSPFSRGAFALVEKGAKLITDPQELFHELER